MAPPQPIDVVVGGGSGMGAATAAAIKSERRLLVVDRYGDAAERTAASLGAEAVVCDITDDGAVESLAARVERLGALVVTAGVSGAEGETTLAVNLVGYAKLLRAFDDAVGEGTAAVLFASMVGLFPLDPAYVAVLDEPLAPDLPGRLRAVGADTSDMGRAYVLSKVGVIRLARNLSVDWWRRGARIVSLSPGLIDTPMLAASAGHPSVDGMLRTVGRVGRPEEVAAVAAFLVSEQASYVTGIDVAVDGGLVTAMQEQAPTYTTASR